MTLVLDWTRRIALITIGLVSLFVGIVGIVVPLLPTVPFLLVTAICFWLAAS